jgi:hypothetical protein
MQSDLAALNQKLVDAHKQQEQLAALNQQVAEAHEQLAGQTEVEFVARVG